MVVHTCVNIGPVSRVGWTLELDFSKDFNVLRKTSTLSLLFLVTRALLTYTRKKTAANSKNFIVY